MQFSFSNIVLENDHFGENALDFPQRTVTEGKNLKGWKLVSLCLSKTENKSIAFRIFIFLYSKPRIPRRVKSGCGTRLGKGPHPEQPYNISTSLFGQNSLSSRGEFVELLCGTFFFVTSLSWHQDISINLNDSFIQSIWAQINI